VPEGLQLPMALVDSDRQLFPDVGKVHAIQGYEHEGQMWRMWFDERDRSGLRAFRGHGRLPHLRGSLVETLVHEGRMVRMD
jgi:hypothetical protein